MPLGFELAESMSGSYYLHDDDLRERAMRIGLRLEVSGLRRFARQRELSVAGVVFAEGLSAGDGGRGRDLGGCIVWRLLDEKRVRYDLDFVGDDGRAYRLRGQRDFFLHDPMDSLTTLAASLYDDTGAEIGRAVLRFEPPMELFALLRSFRPRLRPAFSRG